MTDDQLATAIVQCIYNVRGILGPGYLESVYKNALMRELELNGLNAVAECPLSVMYKGAVVGEFRADIVVGGQVIIELKGVEALKDAHEVQLVNYLTITGLNTGILVNFGGPKLEIRRKYRIYRRPGHRQC